MINLTSVQTARLCHHLLQLSFIPVSCIITGFNVFGMEEDPIIEIVDNLGSVYTCCMKEKTKVWAMQLGEDKSQHLILGEDARVLDFVLDYVDIKNIMEAA